MPDQCYYSCRVRSTRVISRRAKSRVATSEAYPTQSTSILTMWTLECDNPDLDREPASKQFMKTIADAESQSGEHGFAPGKSTCSAGLAKTEGKVRGTLRGELARMI